MNGSYIREWEVDNFCIMGTSWNFRVELRMEESHQKEKEWLSLLDQKEVPEHLDHRYQESWEWSE